MKEYFIVEDILYEWGEWKNITSYMRIRHAIKVEVIE